MEYKIDRMRKGNWGKIVAFFDLKFVGMTSHFDMTIKGFKLVEGVNGKFVSMPSQKGDDGEYHDTTWVDKDTRNILNNLAIKAFESDGEEIEEKPIEELIAAAKDDLPF